MEEDQINYHQIKKEKHIKKPKKNNKKNIWLWPIKIFFITLVMSLLLSVSSEFLLSDTGLAVSILIIAVLLIVSVLFDMLGVAVASASLEPFVAMSSKRVTGAKEAVKLLKSAEKVSSFSSDVVGDMCGILSGAVGASVAMQIYSVTNDIKTVITAAAVSSLIAALTVFGKAFAKNWAIHKPDKIVLFASKIIAIIPTKKSRKKSKHKK